MLSGLEIKRAIELGNIVISDFDESRLNPNSYNIRLGKNLKIYKAGTYTPDYIEEKVYEMSEPYVEEYRNLCSQLKEEIDEELVQKIQEQTELIATKREEFSRQVLREIALDPKKDNETIDIEIPEEGYVLLPGCLYLGETEEYTETYGLIPNSDARSTTGRLGIEIHRTAGFGDNGFKGKWTLEITVTHPVIVYPGMEIGQLYYEVIDGDASMTYNGKYQNQEGVAAARVDKAYRE